MNLSRIKYLQSDKENFKKKQRKDFSRKGKKISDADQLIAYGLKQQNSHNFYLLFVSLLQFSYFITKQILSGIIWLQSDQLQSSEELFIVSYDFHFN